MHRKDGIRVFRVFRKAFVVNRIRKMYNGYNYKEWR